MLLSDSLLSAKERRKILLMTHIVVGYPTLEKSLELVDAMVEAGVDLMELQIPFSEPIADGPVIVRANQVALDAGTTVDQCFEFAREVTRRHSIPFLFMSYYNILFKRGVERFVSAAASAGVQGAIVPDLPPEEGADYVARMRAASLSPIFIFSPRTPDARLEELGRAGDGFVYVVARKGVTGLATELSSELERYLARCRRATPLPLAVGFGLKSRQDIEFLTGKADIAVVGTQSLRLFEEKGVGAVRDFLAGLRA
jgi:tryptophan synthase alpha chain